MIEKESMRGLRLDDEVGTRLRVEKSPLQPYTFRRITSSGEKGSSLNTLARPTEIIFPYVKKNTGMGVQDS